MAKVKGLAEEAIEQDFAALVGTVDRLRTNPFLPEYAEMIEAELTRLQSEINRARAYHEAA
jgi:hypothetical protein